MTCEQLGVHGHGQPGVELEGLGRLAGARDAPTCPEAPGRETSAVADGIPDVLRGADQHALPDRPSRATAGVSVSVVEPVAGCVPETGGAASWLLAVLKPGTTKPGSGCPGP